MIYKWVEDKIRAILEVIDTQARIKLDLGNNDRTDILNKLVLIVDVSQDAARTCSFELVGYEENKLNLTALPVTDVEA